jgi:N-acetylmuramoyl-L-alanine amidase
MKLKELLSMLGMTVFCPRHYMLVPYVPIEKNSKGLRMANDHFNFVMPERFVNTVFLHCSASNSPFHDHVQVIRRWHTEKGWSDIGYHYFIRSDGTIQSGRDLEKVPAAQKGYNRGSIAICLHGLNEEDFTEEQYSALILLCEQINDAYGDLKLTFRGHREVSSKLCPVFDYKRILNLNEYGKYDAGINYNPTSKKSSAHIYDVFASGDDVRGIQLKLNTWIANVDSGGSPSDYLFVDGFYGPATALIVTRFQKRSNLYTDGIFGPVTQKRLDAYIESLGNPEKRN